MQEGLSLVSLFVVILIISPLYGRDGHSMYVNKFAVEFYGDIGELESFARDHGYVLHGQIGSLENHYLLEHPHVHRRSVQHSELHHINLRSHPKINWFEQQKLLSRKKRDFIDIPLDLSAADSDLLHTEHRSKRENKHHLKWESKREMPDLDFNDPLYPRMWYYNGGGLNHTDMNVMGAWKRGVTGKNVVITILDDGIERTHDDLKDNYDPYASYDVNGHDSDPMPRYDYTNENRHGTRCAGEVSAKANNSVCVIGVAYDSRIGGVRMLDGDVYDVVEAASLSHNRSHIDIYSASWGPDDDGRVVDGPGALAKKAFVDGVKQGRNGKGSIFVWASGNGGNTKDSCSCDGYTNSIYTLSISSISQHGRKPWYLEECSSTLASTYSSGTYNEKQIITVDLHNKCTEAHTGTSASAPLAAGIVALTLEVNPSLTWRDVQYITLMTARPLPDGEWVTNGVGRKVSLRYGYGLMDATAMVELAEKWTTVPKQHICEVKSEIVKEVVIPDSGYEEMLDTEACAGTNESVNYLEHVQAKFTIKSKRRGDLVIHLTSPAGTRSTILPQRPNDSDRLKGFKDWAFLSVHFWGENPVGRWKLHIEVHKNSRSYYGGSFAGTQSTNDLLKWSLILYGTEGNPINLVQPTPPTTVPGGQTEGVCNSQCLGGCTGPGADHCNRCKYYKMEGTRLCVQSCPNNFYAEEFTCKKCVEECETCTLIKANQIMCLKCKPGYLLVEGKGTCRTMCDKGYYEGSSTVVPAAERSDIECGDNSIEVFIPEVLLPHANGRNITWRENSCVIEFNGTHYVGSLPLSLCGTTVSIDEDNVTFSNDIFVHTADNAARNALAEKDVTFGEDYDTVIPVECIYPRENLVSSSYVPVKQHIRFFEKRYGDLELEIQQYETEFYDKPVSLGPDEQRKVPLDSDVYIRIAFKFDTQDLRLDPKKCIATSTPFPADPKWHSLIKDGCPANGVRLLSRNDSHDVRFAFKAFDFRSESTGLVYIYCGVSVCLSNDDGCVTGCQSRNKRSAFYGTSKGSHLVSMGPFVVHHTEDPSTVSTPSFPTLFAVTCLVVAMVAIVFAVVGWTRGTKEKPGFLYNSI